MVKKKKTFWVMALAVVIVVSGVARWQYVRQREERRVRDKAASTKVKKAKDDADEDTADKPAPPPPKIPKVTVLGPVAKAHLAEKAFIKAVRDIFLWRSSQPQNEETTRAVLEKFSAVPFEDLPAERKAAWQALLQSWKTGGDASQHAMILNAMFKEHGDGDLVL